MVEILISKNMLVFRSQIFNYYLLELYIVELKQAKFKNIMKILPIALAFICIHARESGFSLVDDEIQEYRNHDIINMFASIEEVTSMGWWVIRLGDNSMTKLPPMAQVIDYAHHPLKSDRLDLALCAKAKFILGGSSGIALVGTVFGTPCAITNLMPFSAMWFRKVDLSIPKLLWSKKLNRYLSFNEILNTNIGNFMFTSQYKDAEIEVLENTPEDILLLTKDIIRRCDNVELEVDVSILFKNILSSNHYGYNSISNVSNSFIEKYCFLL
jgi:putative glycosyltransferase (TIGR04372 family)